MESLKVRLFGLTGTNGAGKGAVASFFLEKGFQYYSLSDVIRKELEKSGKELSRDNLIKTGNSLREKHGADILARMVLKKIKEKSVIDSIRNPKEIEYFREHNNFILLAIDAPVEIRYKRTKFRGRDESASTLEQFILKEKEEMTTQEKGQQLQTCMNKADITIINDSSIEDLHKKLEILL